MQKELKTRIRKVCFWNYFESILDLNYKFNKESIEFIDNKDKTESTDHVIKYSPCVIL